MQYKIAEALFWFVAIIGIFATAVTGIVDAYERWGLIGIGVIAGIAIIVAMSIGENNKVR